jgi:hypothetical protein
MVWEWSLRHTSGICSDQMGKLDTSDQIPFSPDCFRVLTTQTNVIIPGKTMLPKTYAKRRELKIGSGLIPFAFFVFGKLKVYRLAVENVTTRMLKMASLLAKKTLGQTPP